MSYRILTKNGIENTNIDGARDYNFNTNGKSGVLKGFLGECDLSVNGKEIVIASGELRLAGHRIVIDDSESFNIQTTPSNLTAYSLIAKIVVTKTQPEFSIEVRVNPITLIQDNLHLSIDGNGTYEIELGTFEVDTLGNILNLTRTVDLLEISSGSSLTEEEKAKLDTITTDGDGTKYLSNDGTYKEVKFITVDSELSTESENPVQNKVITEALNRKLNKPDAMPNNGSTTRVMLLGNDATTQYWYRANPTYIFSSANSDVGRVMPVYKKTGLTFNHEGTEVTNTIPVGVPQLPYEAANKKYVDDNTTKLYKHTWLVNCKNPNTNDEYVVNIHFYAVSKNVALKYNDEYEIAISAIDIISTPYIEYEGNGNVSTIILHFGDKVPCYNFNIYDALPDDEAIIISIEPQYVGV